MRESKYHGNINHRFLPISTVKYERHTGWVKGTPIGSDNARFLTFLLRLAIQVRILYAHYKKVFFDILRQHQHKEITLRNQQVTNN